MDVLTECITSYHRAVAVSIQCSHLPEFDEEVMEPQPSRIDWLKVTAQEREDYYHESKNLLDQLQLPTEVRRCQNFICTDEKHLEEIENLYAELTIVLLAAASSAIKTTGKKNGGKFNIPGWNSVVKSKHQIAKAAFRPWVNCNRPKTHRRIQGGAKGAEAPPKFSQIRFLIHGFRHRNVHWGDFFG